MKTWTQITDAQVEAAARKIAHYMDFNQCKWGQYTDIARAALEAAWEAKGHAQ